jgi:hypothetical protein
MTSSFQLEKTDVGGFSLKCNFILINKNFDMIVGLDWKFSRIL